MPSKIPEHFWDFMEDGNFDKFAEKDREAQRNYHVCANGHEWYIKPKMGPRIQQCRRCGAIDYGDNDLPLPHS